MKTDAKEQQQEQEPTDPHTSASALSETLLRSDLSPI